MVSPHVKEHLVNYITILIKRNMVIYFQFCRAVSGLIYAFHGGVAQILAVTRFEALSFGF